MQHVRSDMGSRTEPERSFMSFVFMMFYSRIYRTKVLDKVEVRPLISEGKEGGASSQVPFSVLIRTLSTARNRYPGMKEKAIDGDGRLEAVHQYFA